MDGLFIIIAIVIGIVKFAAKQQQNQNQNRGGMRKSPGMNRQNPMQQWMSNPPQQDRTARDMKNRRSEGMKGAAEYVSASMPDYDSEGIEAEDRSQTGSLDYIKQSESAEGVCNEHPEHERKVVPEFEIIEEEPIFNLTEENLLQSIVMAEVLGPPRAMKRSIR